METNVNYEDERFDQVESDKEQALSELEETYGGMIDQADSYFDEQIQASKDWAEKQSQLQQEQTDFTIEQIEQQKAQQAQDYQKEQSGAYADWKKQSNQYGTEAEKMASAGMAGTGFSESSQVGMYNTYQNRVATARESYNRAVLNYNNAIKDARLQNNAVLAEIAYQALQQQLELSLQGFQYKNQLILEQANKKMELDNTYWSRYQDVLNQINTENAFAEEQRQFNLNYEMQQKEFEEQVRQYNQSYELQIQQFNEEIRQYNQDYNEKVRQFNEEIARLKANDAHEHAMDIQQLELQKQQLAEEKRQFEASQSLKLKQLEEEKRQFNEQLALQKKNSVSSSDGGSGKSTKGSYSGGTASVAKANSSKPTATAKGGGSSSSAPTNNMKSITALGYGPISEKKLASLISSGQVYRVLKNGQYYYYKNQTSSANRLKNMGLSN